MLIFQYKSAVAWSQQRQVLKRTDGTRMARQRISRAQHTERGKKHGGWQQKESNRAPTASDAKIPSAFHSLLEPCRAWRNGACCRQGTMKLHVFTDFRSKRIRLYWSHAFLVHDYKPHDFVGSSRIGVKLMTKLQSVDLPRN